MNNDIFPSDVRNAADKIESEWINPKEFEGNGMILQVIKPLEKMKAGNPKYGAKEDDFLVKNGVLEVGEQMRFFFKTVKGNERKFDTKSGPFFIGFKQCEELGVGDWVVITRTGQTTETRYDVEKVEAPDMEEEPSLAAKPEEEAIDPGSIPF